MVNKVVYYFFVEDALIIPSAAPSIWALSPPPWQGSGEKRARMGADALQKAWSKRHGAAVKRGIKQAKARKKVVKQATLALRKAPSKQAIVQRLFTPKRPPPAPAD